jgi:RNA polymerase sigma-70 factor (ECF subfamily)
MSAMNTSDLAFERLYRQHRGDVYRFVLRDVRNPEEAEDVTQTAFLNAYRAIQRGQEPERPRAWLLTIAQNVARGRFRARAARPHEVEFDAELAAAPEHEGPTAGEIREALERLRPNYRAVLVLREIGGLSYAEIAETLDLSVAAVETLIFRARRALREELAPETEGKRVALGGIVLWPLSEVFSNTLGPLAVWLGKRGLAAKVAALGGAAAIGTGLAVQSGLPALPSLEKPAAVAEQQDVLRPSISLAPEAKPLAKPAAKPVAKAAKKAQKPAAAAQGAGKPKQQQASAPAAGGAKAPAVQVPLVELPEAPTGGVQLPKVSVPPVQTPPLQTPPVNLPPVQTPEVDLGPVQVPSVQVPQVQVPPVQVPPIEVALPEVQVPPLPLVGDDGEDGLLP